MTSIQQRAELQRKISQIANDVRGVVQLKAEIESTVGKINLLPAEIDAIGAEIET